MQGGPFPIEDACLRIEARDYTKLKVEQTDLEESADDRQRGRS